MSTHVKIAAGLFLAAGAFSVVGALFSSFIFSSLASGVGASHAEAAPLGAAVLGLTGAALTGLLLVLAVPSLLCGWGLLGRRRWARVLGIILAAAGLLYFPVGTLFGAYVLVVLFHRQTEALFARQAN